MKLKITLLVYILIPVGSSILQIGPLKICSRDSDDLNNCLKDAIQHAFQVLASGFNESRIYFPSIDPSWEKEARLGYNLNQVKIDGRAINTTTRGFSNIKVHNVRANLQDDSFNMEIDASLDKLFLESNYIIEGNFFAIKIRSDGIFNCTMHGMTWTWKLKASPKIINGKKHMVVRRVYMRPEITGLDVNIPELIEGNPDLDSYLRGIIKSGWRVIYRELLPAISKLWDILSTREANRVFKRIPYDELFPYQF